MSKHDTQAMHEPQEQHEEVPLRGPTAPDATEHEERPYSVAALPQIDRILKGTGSHTLLPELFSVLPTDARETFLKTRMGELAVLDGELALEIAQLLKAPPAQVVKAALKGKPPATAKALRAYLVTLDGEQLATITGDTFTKLKAAMPGPLLAAIPTVSETLLDLAEHHGFMEWFIKTTASGVAANLIVRHGSMPMGETIEKLGLWTEWVDHIRPPIDDTRLTGLALEASDPGVKARLKAHATATATMPEAEIEAYRAQHAGDVHAALEGKPTLKELLAAIQQQGGVDGKDSDRVIGELKRLNASADDILQVTSLAAIGNSTALRALLAANDVKAEHVTTFLLKGHMSVDLLQDDTLRASVRKIAPTFRLQDLFVSFSRDAFHETLVDVKHEGFRNWFIDEASPADLLWLATHNPKIAARTTRLVRDRKKGFDWVRDLTSADNETQIRILALNMPDTGTEKYIRDVLLGDPIVDPKETTKATKGAKEVDDDVFVGEDERLEESFNSGFYTLERLADLDEARRAHIGQDMAIVKTIGSSLSMFPDRWARAAHLMNLPFKSTIVASPGPSSATVAYLHTRPNAEEHDVLNDSQLVKDAAKYVHSNLLLVFPSLAEPKRLAKALKQNENLLGLLLAGSDPSLILSLVSHDEVVERAADILEKHEDLLKKLPRYKDMSARGKQGVEKIRGAYEDDSYEQGVIDDYKSNETKPDVDAKRQGDRLNDVDQKKTLVEKIEALGERRTERIKKLKKDDTKHDPTADDQKEENRESGVNALALLDMHRSEVAELLTDRTLRKTVDKLTELTDLPPDIAVPWIGASDLVRMPNALRWWLTFRDSTAVLPHLATNQVARGLVVAGLNVHTGGAIEWMKRLPQGAALDTREERTFDQMRADITDAEAMRLLFNVRFGFPAPDSYDLKTMKETYAIICRLPSGHIQQGRIQGIIAHDIGAAAGQWNPGSKQIEMDDDTKPGDHQDTSYENDMNEWQDKDAFKKRYGFDDARFTALLNAERIEFKILVDSTHKGMVYRMKEQKMDLFTQTVLHEVGHAVDEILGQRTEPVFGFAAWKEYDIDTGFDAWATELGGWDLVSAADKKLIKEVFVDSQRANTPVKDLVPKDHPALDDQYAKVGVVAQLRAGKTFDHEERVKQGSRLFSANSMYGKLFSVDANAAAVAPSAYALNAPAEYFAESYVEYYRGVDGSPGSGAKKGGALASPVKSWFDSHVDKVRFDPRRWDPAYDSQYDEPKKTG